MMTVPTGCSLIGNDQSDCVVDSLNLAAYQMRYISLDSTSVLAEEAMRASVAGTKGRAEALGNRGFVKYMEMDYEESRRLYQASYDECDNPQTRLMACVGLMKICQVTSMNKDYYDYSMKASEYLDAVMPEPDGDTLADKLTETEWNYGHSEYRLASATFYDNQLQDRESHINMRLVSENMVWIERDTAQLARYYTLCSSIGVGSTDMNTKMQYLTEAYVTAKQKNLIYMEACALQKMADILITERNARSAFVSFRSLWNTDDVPEDSTGIFLAEKALRLYKEYGSIYSRGLAYLTISTWFLQNDDTTTALDTALQAARLARIDIDDGAKWSIEPLDWVAKVHEHLSIVYASMGDKEQSDIHRNSYLDILDETRQDKQFEQRKEVLEAEQNKLAWLKTIVITICALIVVGGVVATIIIRKRRNYKRLRLQELMEEEHALLELRLAKNKRSYIDKCTSLSIVNGIMPFLSRGVRAIRNCMDTPDDEGQRTYAMELFRKINDYNEVLTHWIKMKQGMVKLHVESFALRPLFETLAKNNSSFKQKGVTLLIDDTNAVVKADRILTLFMMNTLLDNARKFTDKGHVRLSAKETDDYVEVSVEDTGVGMDMSENVLYSGRKGSGFGLMNCRGIIEKYKKTSRQFDVCRFDVESRVGEGSRFSFRLPKGVMRLMFAVGMWTAAAGLYAVKTQRLLDMEIPEDVLLVKAHAFADSTYYSNVDRNYDRAITYGDSAIAYLNMYYQKQNPDGSKLMVLNGGRYMPELDWWNDGFVTDYVTILDVRNEVAIAALAKKDIALYKFNNKVYARLYRLCGQDKSLEAYCETLSDTNKDTRLAINVVILLVISGILTYLLVQRYLYRLAMQISDEENRRMEYEDNNLHVQNMILDNCLSTIKHETMYYPSKILNILEDESITDLKDAEELAEYYEHVFGMLSEHAMRQLDKVQFKRRTIRCEDLVTYFHERTGIADKREKGWGESALCFVGDEEMMRYLVDNLVDIAKEQGLDSENIRFYFAKSECFAKFAFEDQRMVLDDNGLDRLFYPDNLRYDSSRGLLVGAQLILCKQIVREHDERCGHKGCRIYAEHIEEGGGTRVVFTLPMPNIK